MRVVVTGATGNVGTAVLRALDADPGVDGSWRWPAGTRADRWWRELVSAGFHRPARVRLRRRRRRGAPSVADPARPRRVGDRSGQPARQPAGIRRGRGRARLQSHLRVLGGCLFAWSEGAARRRVLADRRDSPAAFYSRHKAAVERDLDRLAADQPGLRIVRLRPGLIFQRLAPTEIRRCSPARYCRGSCCAEEEGRRRYAARPCFSLSTGIPPGNLVGFGSWIRRRAASRRQCGLGDIAGAWDVAISWTSSLAVAGSRVIVGQSWTMRRSVRS